MKKKALVMFLAFALVVGSIIGGTLAWLTDKTDPVTNTFTTGDIDISLSETTGESYQMIPGYTITKDPKVTVKKNSEKCYLFVKLEQSADFDQYLTFGTEAGWTKLSDVEGVNNVWYRIVEQDKQNDQGFFVLKDNKVKVKDNVTKEMMETLGEQHYPTLTVTAYASQYMKSDNESFTPSQAWDNVSSTTP